MKKFQSTPPVWVVTKFWVILHIVADNFNPHHPCGWWLSCRQPSFKTDTNFNPHHPCGWWLRQLAQKVIDGLFQSTPPVWVVTQCYTYQMLHYWFQSTPPVWVVTMRDVLIIIQRVISIHTTRVGGDFMFVLITIPLHHFNPGLCQ